MRMAAVLILVLSSSLAAAAAAKDAVITFDGFGNVAIGMNRAAVARTLGQPLTQLSEAHNDECEYWAVAKGPARVYLMFSHNTLVRVDVIKGRTATANGIRIGDTLSKIKLAYGKRARITPQKYVAWPMGKYITVKSANGKHAIRFETDHDRVVTFYAGRFPEIEYVERCL